VTDEQQEDQGTTEVGGSPAAPAPVDPALAAAARHFEAGNFREARRLAEQASRSDSAGTRSAAAELAARIAPDAAALWIVAGCLALLAAVVWLTLF